MNENPMVGEVVPPIPDDYVAVCEGWWHPEYKNGQVHDHTDRQPQTYHRLCEQVYTHRPPSMRTRQAHIDEGKSDAG